VPQSRRSQGDKDKLLSAQLVDSSEVDEQHSMSTINVLSDWSQSSIYTPAAHPVAQTTGKRDTTTPSKPLPMLEVSNFTSQVDTSACETLLAQRCQQVAALLRHRNAQTALLLPALQGPAMREGRTRMHTNTY
jgi:hypothetical protein